jgi:hypothetical protein
MGDGSSMMPDSRPTVKREYPGCFPVIRFGLEPWQDLYAIYCVGIGYLSGWCGSIQVAYNEAFANLPMKARF